MLRVHRQGRPYPDPLVKIYDLRTLKALPPIPFSTGPAFITRFPNRPSTLAITSNQGLVQIVDSSNPASNEFHQVRDMTPFRGTTLDTTASSMRHRSSAQSRPHRLVLIWRSVTPTVPSICFLLLKTRLCCLSTGLKASRSIGQMPPMPSRMSTGRSRREHTHLAPPYQH